MIRSIDELIKKPEGKTLKFKQVLSSPKNILKTLVAFANTAGGVLLETIPKIEELGLRYRFTVYLAESVAVPQTTRTEPVTPPVTPPVGKLIIALAKSGEMGNSEIRQRLGLKDRAHLREHYIIPALKEGLIEYTIPDKPNSRLQKYQLTAKGREIVESRGKRGRGGRVIKNEKI